MNNLTRLSFVSLLCALSINSAFAKQCQAHSEDHQVALLELYTSEGCSSCPPADKFVRALNTKGLSPSKIVPLAFHVDYWDYIGWKDPYAKPDHTQRQRAFAASTDASTIYTPQFVINGEDASQSK